MNVVLIVLVGLILSALVYAFVFVVSYNAPIKYLVKSCLTDDEFDALTDVILESKYTIDGFIDGFHLRTEEYMVRIGDGIQGFQINECEKFSVKQRYRFFKRLRPILKQNEKQNTVDIKETLLTKQVQDKLFHKTLDSKLDHEQE